MNHAWAEGKTLLKIVSTALRTDWMMIDWKKIPFLGELNTNQNFKMIKGTN